MVAIAATSLCGCLGNFISHIFYRNVYHVLYSSYFLFHTMFFCIYFFVFCGLLYILFDPWQAINIGICKLHSKFEVPLNQLLILLLELFLSLFVFQAKLLKYKTVIVILLKLTINCTLPLHFSQFSLVLTEIETGSIGKFEKYSYLHWYIFEYEFRLRVCVLSK